MVRRCGTTLLWIRANLRPDELPTFVEIRIDGCRAALLEQRTGLRGPPARGGQLRETKRNPLLVGGVDEGSPLLLAQHPLGFGVLLQLLEGGAQPVAVDAGVRQGAQLCELGVAVGLAPQ